MYSSARPITHSTNGRILGWIVNYTDGTSMFVQSKRVAAGHCVNYGIMGSRIPWYLGGSY